MDSVDARRRRRPRLRAPRRLWPAVCQARAGAPAMSSLTSSVVIWRAPIVKWPVVMSSTTTQVRPRTGSPMTVANVSVICSAIKLLVLGAHARHYPAVDVLHLQPPRLVDREKATVWACEWACESQVGSERRQPRRVLGRRSRLRAPARSVGMPGRRGGRGAGTRARSAPAARTAQPGRRGEARREAIDGRDRLGGVGSHRELAELSRVCA